MVTDGQVSELRRWLANGKSLTAAARMASMDKKTARSPRNYRTRVDPFAEVWQEIEQMLQSHPRLKAKTLFDDLQRRYPGRFEDSTRRTFERRVTNWRVIQGPDKMVFFPQDHHPGKFAASDFTVCNSLGVTIAGQTFKHTLFHCVLTYSNVESVSLCFSESFEALSEGIQNAFWKFGGVPAQHRTDSLSAAVRNHSDCRSLTTRYAPLMDHYGCVAQKTNPRCANENGDVESQNGHLKDRMTLGGRLVCSQCTLIVAKNVRTNEVKYFLSNRVPGRGGWTVRELLRIAFGRWKVEACFREAKEELGWDHFECRSWGFVHRLMIVTIVSQLH